jgi:ABC-type branched-subunit amino acid transport system substrate-binding protein
VNAIRKGGEDRAKIREVILATQGYKGVLGTFNFTPNGDGLSAVSICEIQPGNQFKLVKVVNVVAK